MTSPDGITWTSRTSAADNQWTSVTYNNGLFVAVAQNGLGNRAMISGAFVSLPVAWISLEGHVNGAKQARISWKMTEPYVTQYQVEKAVIALPGKTNR